jgi:hypothetical protein
MDTILSTRRLILLEELEEYPTDAPAWTQTTPVQATLPELLTALDLERTVAGYTDLARRLSAVVDKSPAWGWRYISSIVAGTVAPSPRMTRAVELLCAAVDDTPVALADVEPIEVLARIGQVQPGALLLGAQKQCMHPGCKIKFIPTVPWGKYCPRHRRL